MSFSEEEIEEFKVEANELLDLAEKSLLEIDQGGDYRSSFDAVFRGLHNLKGGAGMMEFTDLQAHTHELETIFMSFKDKNSIPKNYIGLFLNGVDAARSILEGDDIKFNFSVEASSEPESPKLVLESPPVLGPGPVEEVKSETTYDLPESVLEEFLAECDDNIESISRKLQLIEKGEYDKATIDELYREVHSIKGSAYLFSFIKLGDIAHAMESSLESVRNGTHLPSPELLNCLFKSLQTIEALLAKKRKKESDEKFDSLVGVISKALSLTSSRLQLVPTLHHEVPNTNDETTELDKTTELSMPLIPSPTPVTNPSKEKESEGASSIRVSVSLLDSLMTLMGEMVLVRNQVLQYSNKTEDLEFSSMSKRLNVVTSEIQGEMMKTRMQPIGNVLEKFNRVVRDLSHDLKKNIDLVIHGADTELDKSLLEAIKDPLTHIVRNSCDHGIELPQVRTQSGKPERGTITIKSYHEGGQVIIDITDDGKGLHKDQLVKKALEKGIITSTQVGQLSEKEIYDLIFAPGFSTAAQVTNVSGRGVGMDVVRTNIEKMGGNVELSGSAGVGTSIKIKIPLTLAIVPALIVRCGDGTFAIPQVKIEELVRVEQTSESKIEILHGIPVYRLRGNVLPLVDLNKILSMQSQQDRQYAAVAMNIVILSAENFSFGVIVDEIQDTVDIVVKPLNRLLKSLLAYSGATILGDGSISLILDVLGISKIAQLGFDKAKHLKEDNQSQQSTDIQEFLLVRVGNSSRHAMAMSYVLRLEEFRPDSVELSGHQRVIRYRDDILPLISLNEALGYQPVDSNRSSIPVIVVERAGKFYGLEVDEIIDIYSTSLEMKDATRPSPGIFGNLNDPQGLIVVVDPFQVIQNAFFPQSVESFSSGKSLATESMDEEVAGRILLVEDTVFFRKAITNVLEKRGYQVAYATNGKEAIDLVKREAGIFDLIVSDIEMPLMNGFELARALRKLPNYKTVPMMAVSSKADTAFRKEGMAAGFDMYLEKLKPDVLLAAIAELLRSKKDAA